MIGLAGKARLGLAAIVATATLTGYAATIPTAAVAAECYEQYVGADINEYGIECPGNPAIWKSYTYASNGFGYFTETTVYANGDKEVRMNYQHQDGRLATSDFSCARGTCRETSWNGVPFPFDGDAAHH
jgi:hypothetical protein